MIERTLYQLIQKRLDDKRIIIVLGPRRVGKTTLLNLFRTEDTLYLNGDDPDTRNILSDKNTAYYKNLIGDRNRLIVDEAQRIENIGLTLKQIVDNIPTVKVLVTGSSSLELSDSIKEPLTGRKWEFNLFPLSAVELMNHFGDLEEKRMLEQRLIYGTYPDVVTNPGDAYEVLQELTDSYLYKDILTLENIRKPGKLETLVQAIAFQLGNEVSYKELSDLTGLNHETVYRYINILEKSFVLFTLHSFSRNLRNELKKSKKIYFYDLGVRNAIIDNFNSISLRNDVGALWENYLILERIKYQSYNRIFSNNYFWRTHAQQEIDFIEEGNGRLRASEFKWNPRKSIKFSTTFKKAYPEASLHKVNRDNYLSFIESTSM